MALSFPTLDRFLGHGFDALIDVRSPAEYAEDHVPGAINLPVLSNEERAEVGTIYKQVSPFDARKIGGALVAQNTARHLRESLAHHDGSWRPLVYCWRGGQRSGFFASFLREVGWRAETVDGGYRTFRRLVHDQLYGETLPHRIILLDGNTGTAKTEVLKSLRDRDVQVVDLEGLAVHRGSLLGGMAEPQPAQKAFETRLATELALLDPDRPVLIEAESSKIGRINLPPALWSAMIAAPRIDIAAPMSARAAHLVVDYEAQLDETDAFIGKLQPLRRFRGHAAVDRWEDLLRGGDRIGLVTALMEEHYDPTYAKSRSDRPAEVLGTFRSDTLDQEGRERLADRIERFLKGT